MVEIAKALSFESRVIIMDEPTDALTDRETQTLFRIIAELKAEGRGIVYISHRLHELFAVCERITVLRDGAFIAEVASADCDEARLIELMVGRSLDEQYPHLARAPGVALLNVERYSGHGLRDISFTLHAGEILGIFGLMGQGAPNWQKCFTARSRHKAAPCASPGAPSTTAARKKRSPMASPTSPKTAKQKASSSA